MSALPDHPASLAVVPLAAIERVRDVMDAAVFRASSDDPQFRLVGDLPSGGTGVYLFEADVLAMYGCSGTPAIYFDFGEGFDSRNAMSLRKTPLSAKPYSGVVRLNAAPIGIRFDPCASPGEFLCSEVAVSRISDERAAKGGIGPLPLPRPLSLGAKLAESSVLEEDEPVAGESPRIGVILHLFYEELWPEMAAYVRNVPMLRRLYVSVPEFASPDLEERIRREFPVALVRRVPNRGRDVLPFLQWLDVARLHGIDLVCKIHAKRSAHVPIGEAWRRDMLDKLLGSRAVVQGILSSLRDEPSIGIIGPGGHVVPSSYYWERNALRVEELSRQMDHELEGNEFEYAAGSMFWARTDALLPLRRLNLRDEDFEAEQGQVDGTLAHALERCFPIAAVAAGFGIAESPNPSGKTVRDFAPLPPHSYLRWIEEYEPQRSQYAELAAEESLWADRPVISIVMPTYETPQKILVAAIESVIRQVYPHWELCIADDASSEPRVREVLEDYSRRDPRIKVTYRRENGHISAASNSALALATGSHVALLDHDDELHPLALHYVAEAIVANPGCELVFTDEDKIGMEGRRRDPYFKCDFNYELLLAHNMVCHLACYRTARMREIGGFREGFEGAQDYDLVLRFIEGLEAGKVVHVPRILYHWRVAPGSTAHSVEEKPYAQSAARKAIVEHLERTGCAAEVVAAPEVPANNRVRFAVPPTTPEVAILIPTRDRADLLGLCIDSIRKQTTYPNYRIFIVDNGSAEPATFELFERIRKSGVTVVRDDTEFNFSAINNRMVKAVASEFVCLMNNDIEIVSPDWLEEMVGMAARTGVGVVGARLWYPDGRLQHGGAILGIGGVAGHSHKYLPKGDRGYFGRAVLHQELSAVTAACLLIRRRIYEEVGGFDESLKVAFNDIDFCLQLRKAGYRNVWTPYAEMIHHESASRGHETTPEKQARFRDEVLLMQSRWGETLLNDPAYSPNLTLDTEDFAMAWPPRVRLPGAANASN